MPGGAALQPVNPAGPMMVVPPPRWHLFGWEGQMVAGADRPWLAILLFLEPRCRALASWACSAAHSAHAALVSRR